jgi:hypothetical protein
MVSREEMAGSSKADNPSDIAILMASWEGLTKYPVKRF